MHVLGVRVQELGVHLKHTIELKASQPRAVCTKQRLERDARILAAHNGRPLVEPAQPRLESRELRLIRHQIDLVEQQQVGERHLLDRLVLDALGLNLVQVLFDVKGVDKRDDRVEPRVALDVLVDEEGLRDRRGIGQAGRLNDDEVELGTTILGALHQLG